MIRLTIVVLFLSFSVIQAADADPRLKKFLAKFPQSDLNGDGTLTLEEAEQFRGQMRGKTPGKKTVKTAPQPSGKRYSADELANIFEAREFGGVKYRFFQPKVVEGEKYPLILSLHGAAGKGTENVKNLRSWNGIVTEPEFQAKHPCYVVVPQSAGPWHVAGSVPNSTPELTATFSETWQRILKAPRGLMEKTPPGNLGTVFELLDSLAREYRIDVDRVYVLGQSMGGFGTFEALAVAPERFAAGIPCAGGLSPWQESDEVQGRAGLGIPRGQGHHGASGADRETIRRTQGRSRKHEIDHAWRGRSRRGRLRFPL